MIQTSVLGLGAMGSALALALIAAGNKVTVWNRTPARADPLAEAGAQVATSAADAFQAAPVSIVCVKSHENTRALVAGANEAIKGRIVVDLSTGSADEAAALAAELEVAGARWQIGMINTYPKEIGKPEASIFTVGSKRVWDEIESRIKALGGASRRVGDDPAMLAALFAAMFTTRQGYMCGMLHGAAVARAAGLSPEVFADTLTVSVTMAEAYNETFRRTVLSGNYDNPGAAIDTYAAAFDDALRTFEELGAPIGLPKFMSDLVHEGAAAGFGDKELTALYEHLASCTRTT